MKKLRIGLDFDGVVAYNPLRLARSSIKYFKSKFLKINTLTFFTPRSSFEKALWVAIHESSVFRASGADLLEEMSRNKKVEFHLITGRYGVLKGGLYNWLKKNKLTDVFASIQINEQQEQPHKFKNRVLNKLKIDYYVEDNLDIVEYLNKNNRCKTLWIYNILDKRHNYIQKYPSLKRALEKIARDESLV